MRTFFIIVSCLLATTMIAQEKQGNPNMPFYNKQKIEQALKQQTEYDTVWLPLKVTTVNPLDTMFKSYEEYEYNEAGLLQRFTVQSYTGIAGITGIDEYIYNQTYLIEGKDVLDTATYYKYDVHGNLIPDQRYVYEHNVSWIAYNIQKWANNQWVTTSTYREEKYLMDTLDVVGFCYWQRSFSNGVLNWGEQNILEQFDERRNPTVVSCNPYRPETGKYVKLLDCKYLYDENNVCYEEHICREYGGKWIVRGKLLYEWDKFHGFLNGDILYHRLPFIDYYYCTNKPKTISSYTSNDGVHFDFDWTVHCSWNIDGNHSAECSTYYEWGDSLYLSHFDGVYYDEHGNSTGDIFLSMYMPYHHGNYHDTVMFNKHTYINYYDERNRLYKIDCYQLFFDDKSNEGNREDVFLLSYVVDSFTYVLKKVNIDELLASSNGKLKIIPNPTDGYVKVIASGEMEEICLYAMDGRLVYNRKATGKETELGNYILPKGTYVVKARLKNGKVQTGKLVVR